MSQNILGYFSSFKVPYPFSYHSLRSKIMSIFFSVNCQIFFYSSPFISVCTFQVKFISVQNVFSGHNHSTLHAFNASSIVLRGLKVLYGGWVGWRDSRASSAVCCPAAAAPLEGDGSRMRRCGSTEGQEDSRFSLCLIGLLRTICWSVSSLLPNGCQFPWQNLQKEWIK